MRNVVSYDDITANPLAAPDNAEPETAPIPAAQLGPQLPSSAPQPPAKKRKKSYNNNTQPQQRGGRNHPRGNAASFVQHWDEPSDEVNYGGQDANMYEESTVQVAQAETEGEEGEEGEEEEESRGLTHQEIWDDSALIAAWDSATAEYEKYHGKSKRWKDEPVKKSPLWYNVPPKGKKKKVQTSTTKTATVGVASQGGANMEDSTPLNFDTFIPTHDPSLASAGPVAPALVPGPDYAQYPSGLMVGPDEAFQRALSAMYWGGYWTAVYHCQRQVEQYGSVGVGQEQEQEGEGEVDEEMNRAEGEEIETEDLVSTQR